MKKNIFLITLLICFLKSNYAQNFYQAPLVFKVPNRTVDLYLNPNYYNIAITSSRIIKAPVNGSYALDTNHIFSYTPSAPKTKDSASIAVVYTDLTTFNAVNDTIHVLLTSLGQYNTSAEIAAVSKIHAADFYGLAYSDTNIGTYAWSFGDGQTSNKAEVTHTYAKAGNYQVCFTAIALGDTANTCQTVMVYDSNYVAANDDGYIIEYPDTVKYFDVLSNDMQAGASLQLLKGLQYANVSIVGNQFAIKATILKNGNLDTLVYSICKNGNCDTAIATFYQYQNYNNYPCFADFTYASNQLLAKFNSTPKCKANKNVIKAYLWTFGDGDSSTTSATSHFYKIFGQYQVCLEITDTFNLSNKSCQTIYISDQRCYPDFYVKSKIGMAEFYNTQGCEYVLQDSTLGYLWDFGDSSFSTQVNDTHSYSKAGIYKVGLTRFTPRDTVTNYKNIQIYDTTTLILNDDVFYTDTKTNPAYFNLIDNDIFYLNTQFTILDSTKLGTVMLDGSGELKYMRKNKYTFGDDTLVYTACNKNKCDTAIVYITSYWGVSINGSKCQANIAYSGKSLNIQFNANTTCKNGGQVGAYYWIFSDGQTSTAQNPKITFTKPGHHYIQLFTIDTTGDWDYAYENIMIIDTTLNGGCVYATDDYYSTNEFNENRYNVLNNDLNIPFYSARTVSLKDFSHGITMLDTTGGLVWLRDSAYTGCDTMVYEVSDATNANCKDTAVVYVCYEPLAFACVDSMNIDTNYACYSYYEPVCGCNKVEYNNACEAIVKGGVNYFYNGPCDNLPPYLFLNNSVQLKTFDIYANQESKIKYRAEDPNVGNVVKPMVSLDPKNWMSRFIDVKLDEKNNELICYSSTNQTGQVKLYSVVCDNWGYCHTDTILINVNKRSSTSISTVASLNFVLYPNPASDAVTIRVNAIEDGDYLKIMNASGQCIQQIKVSELTTTVSVADLAPGFYFIELMSHQDMRKAVTKLIKQ